MSMKYTKIPTATFSELQMNSGMLLADFDPASGTITEADKLGATTGGITFTDTPTFTDAGDDIDNCPKNTKELKRVSSREIKLAGTYVAINTARAKSLVAAADISATDTTKIVPRDTLATADFADIWWVGDYSDKNGAANGGSIAIKLSNALNTAGFSMKSSNDAKGQFAFSYLAHYSISDPDAVPYEMYIKAGTAEPAGT